MTKRSPRTLAAIAGLGTALAIPASAMAHPSVFETTAKVVVPNTTPAQFADQTQYVFTNHGTTAVFRESNGALDHGGLNYKVLPGAYRNQAGFTMTQRLAEGDTGVQIHATCRGAATLTESVILAWQGTDPFYNYIPWQPAAAGYDDDASTWIPVVKQATGVDLSTLTDDAALAAACASIGGTFTPADTIVTSPESLASHTIEHEVEKATAPLQAQVTQLQASLTAATAAVAPAATAAAAGPAPLALTLTSPSMTAATLASAGTTAKVTGPAGGAVRVALRIPAGTAAKLGLPSRVIANATVTIPASGSTTVTLAPGKRAKAGLSKLQGSVPVTGLALQMASATATLAR